MGWLIAYIISCYAWVILFWGYNVVESQKIGFTFSDEDTMLIGGTLILAPLIPIFCIIHLIICCILEALCFIWEMCKKIMYGVGDVFQGIVILAYWKNH